MDTNISISPEAHGVAEVAEERGTFFRRISVPLRLRIAETIGALESQVAESLPERSLFVTGLKSGELLGHRLAASLGGEEPLVVTNNTMDDVEKVVAVAAQCRALMIVGIGGGRVIDVCKYAAHLRRLPFYCIPTQISHDGIGSPVAVLRVKAKERPQSLGASMPSGIFVPLFTVVNAPKQSILSGIGDLISNLSAIEDWKLAENDGKEKSDDYGMMISRVAARMIYVELLSNLINRGWTEPRFVANLTEGLVLSGIAMEIAGSSRPCSGSEHMISHSIDELFGGITSHGLQVGFGTVVAFFLHDRLEEMEQIRRLYQAIGIPVRPSDLGLSFEQFSRVMTHARHTRPNRYTILDQTPLDVGFLGELYGILECEQDPGDGHSRFLVRAPSHSAL